jgi:hypothetical protein
MNANTAPTRISVFAVGLFVVGILFFGTPRVSRAQNPPLLQISSPTAGTVVNPGQTITVSVSSPAEATFTQVMIVLGQGSSASAGITNSLPAQLSVTVPTRISLGLHAVAASGVTSGQMAQSFPVFLDVERTDLPQSLSPNISNLIFSAQGQQFPLIVSASYSDGSYLDARASSYVSYASSNTNVATVDSRGLVTAVGTGSATVTATYAVGGQNVQASIAVSVPPAVLTASPSSLSFGNQAVGTTSATQPITLTNVSGRQVNTGTITTPGAFPETDNCASTGLAPGGTCTITVAFAPAVGVTASGWLAVHNDTTTEAPAFALSGTGTPPACISNLYGRGTPGSGLAGPRIDVSWSAQTGATSYDVLRSTTNGGPYYTLLGNVTTPAYSDRGGIPTNGSTYYYVVRPVGSSGEVCQSNQASVTIP